MWRVAVVGLVLGTGCDQVFDLERPLPLCPSPVTGPPTADDDLDGRSNQDDNCPRINNASQHDEDGDALGDVCDLCAATDETVDDDCDGVGNACDPDSARRDVALFFGFDNTIGLTVSPPTEAVAIDDVFRVRTRYGFANVDTDVDQAGLYEAQFEIVAIPANQFSFVEIRFGCALPFCPSGYYAWLAADGTQDATLEIGEIVDPVAGQDPRINVLRATIGRLVAGRYTLRIISGPTTRAELEHSGGTAVVDGGAGFPAKSPRSRFVLNVSNLDADVAYLLRVGPPLP